MENEFSDLDIWFAKERIFTVLFRKTDNRELQWVYQYGTYDNKYAYRVQSKGTWFSLFEKKYFWGLFCWYRLSIDNIIDVPMPQRWLKRLSNLIKERNAPFGTLESIAKRFAED